MTVTGQALAMLAGAAKLSPGDVLVLRVPGLSPSENRHIQDLVAAFNAEHGADLRVFAVPAELDLLVVPAAGIPRVGSRWKSKAGKETLVIHRLWDQDGQLVVRGHPLNGGRPLVADVHYLREHYGELPPDDGA